MPMPNRMATTRAARPSSAARLLCFRGDAGDCCEGFSLFLAISFQSRTDLRRTRATSVRRSPIFYRTPRKTHGISRFRNRRGHLPSDAFAFRDRIEPIRCQIGERILYAARPPEHDAPDAIVFPQSKIDPGIAVRQVARTGPYRRRLAQVARGQGETGVQPVPVAPGP